MKILTWNILDQPRDLGALWGEIVAVDPDVLALQEVEWWAYEQLLESPLTDLWPHEGVVRHAEQDCPGWLHMRSRAPIDSTGVEVFRSSQTGRGMLWCDIGGVTVATTHLESHPSAGALRLAQIDEMHLALADRSCAVIAGDFNFDDGPEADRFAELGWADAALEAARPTPTWDPTTNKLAARHGFPGEVEPMRIDRIYSRGVSVVSFETGASSHSDHRWVCAEL